MADILKILKNTYILSSATTEALEQYIAAEYPDLSKDEAGKVLIQYLQQQIEEHLTLFDAKYRTFIEFRLIHNIIGRRPYEITAEDVFKACLQLNVGIESFYNELIEWLHQTLAGNVSKTELAAYVAQLRRLIEKHPEQPLDELLPITMIAGGLATNPEAVKGEIPVLESVPLKADLPVKGKGVQFTAVAGISLLLLAGSMWWFRAYLQRVTSQTPFARTTLPAVAALPNTGTGEVKLKKYPVYPRRISRNNPVSRSYLNKTLITNLADNHRPKPDQGTLERLPENRVIVGYEDVVINNVTTRVPITQPFSAKLEMQAVAYGVAKKSAYENAVADGKNMKNDKSDPIEQMGDALKNDEPDQNGVNPSLVNKSTNRPVKLRTVGVDPKVIAPGSRLYIKFPQEYQDLNGIYIAGESRTENQEKRIDLFFGETTEDNDEVKKNIEAFGSRDVEVYVLKKE